MDQTQLESRRIGLIGLGAMGIPMARNVSAAGWDIIAFDVSSDQVERARSAGVMASLDSSILSDRDTLIVMVATPSQLLQLASLPLLAEGTLVIVMSTVGPDALRTFEDAVSATGTRLLDCPVTGGVAGAEAGALSLFVAGDEGLIASSRPLLESMGKLFLCGDRIGDGQAVKVVNQHLAASHLAIAAEVLGLARAMGLDLERTLELVSSGAGSSWMLRDRGPRMLLPADERPDLTHAAILAKDVGLVQDAARARGYDAPILDAVSGQWSAAIEAGLARRDDSSIIDVTG